MKITDNTALTAQELALYYGCQVRLITNIGDVVTVELNSEILFLVEAVEIESVKPILRPLSDMTAEELIESGEITAPGNNTPKDIMEEALLSVRKQGINAFDFSELTPSQVFSFTAYLLSRGFDLFNWVEQGKAIPKEAA